METQERIGAPVSFTTDAFDPPDRYDAYRDYTRSINDISIPREARADFAASTTNWVLGRVMVGIVRTPAMRLSRSERQVRQDDLDHWVLRVSRSGDVDSRVGERSYSSGAGDLVLESLALPYEDRWTPGEWVSVAFPRDLTPGLGRRGLRDTIGPLRHTPSRVLGGFLLSLAEALPRAGQWDMRRLTEATQATIVALLDETPSSPPPPGVVRGRVEQVIRENIASARLTPHRIAELAGISRSTLYRLFEEEGGVAARVRQLRLDMVRADLADPAKRSEPIARIAERWGFFCTSAFNRSFRTAFGMTPGDVREQAIRAEPVSAPRREAGSAADLASLVFVR